MSEISTCGLLFLRIVLDVMLKKMFACSHCEDVVNEFLPKHDSSILWTVV